MSRLQFVRLAALLSIVAITAGCGAEGGFRWSGFYDEMRINAAGLAFAGGDWADDFGDAAYYGTAFFINAGNELGREDYRQQARASVERSLDLIRSANDDYLFFMENLEELLMGALGTIEYLAATGERAGIDDLEGLIDQVNRTVRLFGTYLDVDIESYALATYGPTTVTAVVALLNLRHAQLLNTARAAEFRTTGLEVLAVIDRKAFTGTMYRFTSTGDWLEIYPNVSMIIANTVAFELTGEPSYLERSLAAHAAIQGLRDTAKRCYRSPYSAETMGARTEDYITLSSQNYTILADAMLYRATGDRRYRDEIDGIVGFIHDYLYVDGRILHHWMDGRVALPTDPEYFCSGCNLQFLYALWYARHYVFGEGA